MTIYITSKKLNRKKSFSGKVRVIQNFGTGKQDLFYSPLPFLRGSSFTCQLRGRTNTCDKYEEHYGSLNLMSHLGYNMPYRFIVILLVRFYFLCSFSAFTIFFNGFSVFTLNSVLHSPLRTSLMLRKKSLV